MCADSVKPEKLDLLYSDNNWIAEMKYDGSRYCFQIRKEGCMFSSRTESVKGGQVDKVKNVPQICEEALKHFPINTVLDGEVDVVEGRNFKRVQGIMGSLPERALALQKDDPLVYKVFDILELDGVDLRNRPYKERRHLLEALFNSFPQKYIRLCEIHKGEEAKRDLFAKAMREKAEGIMLKNLDGIYKEDKRPANTWVKIKKVANYDGIVKGYKYGTPGTKFEHGLGTLTVHQYLEDGSLVEVAECGGVDFKERVEFKERLDKGETFIIEFSACELFEETHRYRHPSFVRIRTDKNEKECHYGKI